MRICIVSICMLLAFQSKAQDLLSAPKFSRSFERIFFAPDEVYQDTFYNIASLLKIKTNKKYEISSITFSDDAQDWMIAELEKIKTKLDTKEIQSYVRRKRIKALNVIYPVIIVIESNFNTTGSSYPFYGAKHYSFNGVFLNGDCLFMQPIGVTFYSPQK